MLRQALLRFDRQRLRHPRTLATRFSHYLEIPLAFELRLSCPFSVAVSNCSSRITFRAEGWCGAFMKLRHMAALMMSQGRKATDVKEDEVGIQCEEHGAAP